jgi:uncharacterized membrane protein
LDVDSNHAGEARSTGSTRVHPTEPNEKTGKSVSMRKTIAKAITWRLIGTAEIFAISFWTTGHMATAGHTAGIAAITSLVMYVAHELAWQEGSGLISIRGSRRPEEEEVRKPAVA